MRLKYLAPVFKKSSSGFKYQWLFRQHLRRWVSRRVVVNSIDNTYKKQITYVTFHLWEKWTWDADDKGHLCDHGYEKWAEVVNWSSHIDTVVTTCSHSKSWIHVNHFDSLPPTQPVRSRWKIICIGHFQNDTLDQFYQNQLETMSFHNF